MFLIRTAFWLTLLLLILPIDIERDESAEQPTISTFQAIGAAQSVIHDISTFCERNAATCETGGAALTHLGQKARASAKIVYDYLDDSPAIDSTAEAPQPDAPQDTLTAADRQPVWHGPRPKPSA